MNRPPQRSAGAIQNEPDPAGRRDTQGVSESPPTGKQPIALGWRLTLVVWGCAFLGLFLYELVSALLKVFQWKS